ncbi:MAG: NAD(P)H-dependent flavin oxidoreductase, partial [Geminicoccales bacterium]
AGNVRPAIGFITWSLARRPHLLELALESGPPAIMLSFGDVRPFASRIKAAGPKLICQVQSVVQAQDVAAAGADVVIAQGTEAGGHGASRATLPLVPAVVDALAPLPVVAAGGIADGRGLAAALMLGACGVLMGTRFYASQESLVHPAAKQRVVEASGDDTLRSSLFDLVRELDWPAPYDLRTISNPFSERWAGDLEGVRARLPDERACYLAAREAGDFDVAPVIAGEGIDLIRDVPPAAELVTRIVREAEDLLAGAAARIVDRAYTDPAKS